jgi:hypothetical protein
MCSETMLCNMASMEEKREKLQALFYWSKYEITIWEKLSTNDYLKPIYTLTN